MLTGTFTCGALSRDPFLVLQGKFQVFNDGPRTPDTRNFSYGFDLISTTGEILRFNGRKIVDPSATLSLGRTWSATSTLYTTITRARDNVTLGRGVLHVNPLDFVTEMKTLASTGASWSERTKNSLRYLTYFGSMTTNALFSPFTALAWPGLSAAGRVGETPPTELCLLWPLTEWSPQCIYGTLMGRRSHSWTQMCPCSFYQAPPSTRVFLPCLRSSLTRSNISQASARLVSSSPIGLG